MAWNGQRIQAPHMQVVPIGLHQRLPLAPPTLDSVEGVPGFSRGRFPPTYEAAQKAIASCSRIDECKSWSDKAAALASYARQAKDDTLRVMAERIHARAIRRCGELLKQVRSGQGSKNQHGELRDGAVTRREAARKAGLSERQRVTALRVAALPRPKFEALVESRSPPTVTQLADLGRDARAPHPDTLRAAKARKMFWSIRDFCEENTPADLAGAFTSRDDGVLREFVAALHQWLDQFIANLPEADEPESND